MKKVGILILTLIIALGSLGAGYAMWSDTIYVDGTVNTGEVCLDWLTWDDSDICYGNEGEEPDAVPGYPPTGADLKYPNGLWDKNVACTEIDRDPEDPSTLIITVYNAYPGYYADWELEWENCGTIPIRIQNAYLVAENFNIASGTDWTDPQSDGEIWIDWVISGGTLQGVQLEPGDQGASSFKLLIMQTAEQGETYTFRIKIEGVQWDEYDPANIEQPVGGVDVMPL
jgi:hypothetical protein